MPMFPPSPTEKCFNERKIISFSWATKACILACYCVIRVGARAENAAYSFKKRFAGEI